MSKKAEDVYREAMALSDKEQEKLRDLLMSGTSNGYASPEIARAWREEIKRRERDIAEGRGEWLPGEAVIDDLLKALLRMRYTFADAVERDLDDIVASLLAMTTRMRPLASCSGSRRVVTLLLEHPFAGERIDEVHRHYPVHGFPFYVNYRVDKTRTAFA